MLKFITSCFGFKDRESKTQLHCNQKIEEWLANAIPPQPPKESYSNQCHYSTHFPTDKALEELLSLFRNDSNTPSDTDSSSAIDSSRAIDSSSAIDPLQFPLEI